MAEEEPRKRSRFDQGGPEMPVKSRFDRRSRSPETRERPDRERSPLRSSENDDSNLTPVQRAVQAAAKINAELAAKKGIQHVDVPPIRSTSSPSAAPGAAKSPPQPDTTSGTLNDEIYQQDGDYIKDIEINDLRNRYTLTKGSTQKMIKEKTGADVTTRGNFYPDKTMATTSNPPLYLHITSTTKEKLEEAVAEIQELMKQELPQLIDERRFRGNRRDEQQQQQFERPQRRKWPEERIPIDLEPIRGFNLRAQVVGHGGQYVKHIQQESRCRVQIKGRGSGFLEQDTNMESDEQMYLHVAGPEQEMVDEAKRQCLSLLETVRENYENFKAQPPPPPRGGPGGYDNDRGGYHNRGNHRQNSGSYGGGSAYGGNNGYGANDGNNGYGGGHGDPQAQAYAAAAAAAAQGIGTAAAPEDPAVQLQQAQAWTVYYAQNPDQDPYRDQGGYGTFVAGWIQQLQAQVQAQQMQQQQQSTPVQAGAEGETGVPPPPPPPPPPGL